MARPIHFEIHVTDAARAQKFYETVFGWKFTAVPSSIRYWLIDTGTDVPGINGGMLERNAPAPSAGQGPNAFVCTIGVDSLDATLGKALGLGAILAMEKTDMGGIGSLAYIKDPDGNLLGMLQPERQ